MEIIKLGLTEGRHDLPDMDGFIFPAEVDPTDVDGIFKTVSQKIRDLVGIGQATRTGMNQNSYDDILCFTGEKHVHLYVTGLTVLTAAVISYCAMNGVRLTLFHYNRDTRDYYPQPMFGGY